MAHKTAHTLTPLALAAVLLSACPGLAQISEDPPVPILTGPKVNHEQAPATLVRRDFSGILQRLERHPAEAALDLVLESTGIDADRASAIEAVLAERRRVLDDLVIDRLDLLIKLSNGGAEADRAEAMAALREALAPLARGGALGDRIREHLPEPAAREHARLENEYMRAAIEDRRAMLESEVERASQRGIRVRARAIETLVLLGAEVRAAYERTIVLEAQRIEELIALLQLSPEQEGKVRRIIQAYSERTLLDKDARRDDQQRLGVFLEVAAELTPQQRRKLLEHVRGEGARAGS